MKSFRSGLLALSALFITACATVEPAQNVVRTPADLYGDLFHQVQMRRLYPDGKTFVDAEPRVAPASIMADYREHGTFTDETLKAFIEARFDVPGTQPPPPPIAERTDLIAHIDALWPTLTRPPVTATPGGSALPLEAPFVVPGGRFREIYYWDSYFTMLGLKADGRDDLVESMIDDFTGLIEDYGHIPNGARTYYVSRSQPPFFYLMVGLSEATDPAMKARRLKAMRAEHAFWMRGQDEVAPGGAEARVVILNDGSVLNRYWDDRDTPRDESYREDVLVAQKASRPAAETYRDLRAGAESGWDFSSRWLADGRSLETIQTTAIVPVDLNSLLHGMERAIADDCAEVRDTACVEDFTARSTARKSAIDTHLWQAAEGRYLDYQWRDRRPLPHLSAATLYPLFTGVADPAQAQAVAETTRRALLAQGGLRTTTNETGQQWDTPNGWAPLQWVGVDGLRRYRHDDLADDIAERWVATVEREYRASGRMLEKYDVEAVRPGGGGEYPLQDGFGWTNGVTRILIALD